MRNDAASHTSVANAALAELGSTENLTSFALDQSSSAFRARALWQGILMAALARHPWNFAIRRATLNPGALVDGIRSWQLPQDCVRWLPDDAVATMEREGDTLVGRDRDALHIRYIAYVDDPALWSPGFVRVMTLQLAAAMAEGVTQSEGIKNALLERGEMEMRAARRVDGLETGARRRSGVTVRSDWLNARSRSYAWRGR